jgi:two-component system cell cycle response regulator DivK
VPERVLIVDDNPANLKLASFVLAGAGFDVRTAADGAEALALLVPFQPRLVLMDLQMPGLDGFEVTRRIKADAQTRHIRVVALTAYAMKGDEERVRAAGCDGYIAKPIDTRTLAAEVARHLEAQGADA